MTQHEAKLEHERLQVIQLLEWVKSDILHGEVGYAYNHGRQLGRCGVFLLYSQPSREDVRALGADEEGDK